VERITGNTVKGVVSLADSNEKERLSAHKHEKKKIKEKERVLVQKEAWDDLTSSTLWGLHADRRGVGGRKD